MLKGQSLLDYTNLFSPNEYEKYLRQIMQNIFKKFKIIYGIICVKYIKFKKFEIYIFEKTLVPSIICSKCISEDEKVFKGE